MFDLLEVIRCRRWYPNEEHNFLTEDDVQLMRDFVKWDKWDTGKKMRTEPTLNPPNTRCAYPVEVVRDIDQPSGGKDCSVQPLSMEKRMQERDCFAVSVDAKECTEVETEIDVVSEEVPMDLGKPVSSEG